MKRHNSSPSASLAAIGGRDSSLFLFRALGKILYCKREVVSAVEETEVREVRARPHPLPAHLRHCERSPLLVEPEVLVLGTVCVGVCGCGCVGVWVCVCGGGGGGGV